MEHASLHWFEMPNKLNCKQTSEIPNRAWNLFIDSLIDWQCHHYNINKHFISNLWLSHQNFGPTLLLLPNVHWHTHEQWKISLTFSNSSNLKTISIFSMPFSWKILETSLFTDISESFTEKVRNVKKNDVQKTLTFLNHPVYNYKPIPNIMVPAKQL